MCIGVDLHASPAHVHVFVLARVDFCAPRRRGLLWTTHVVIVATSDLRPGAFAREMDEIGKVGERGAHGATVCDICGAV